MVSNGLELVMDSTAQQRLSRFITFQKKQLDIAKNHFVHKANVGAPSWY
jgi:hypothetical protein